MQSQSHRSVLRKSPPSNLNSTIAADHAAATEIRAEERHLFMHEDEMASWLHYPLLDDASFDHNFCSDLLYPTPQQCLGQNANPSVAVRSSRVIEHKPPTTLTTTESTVTGVTPRPPIPPVRRIEPVPENKVQNFALWSSHKPRANVTGPSSSKSAARESTMVDSSDTPVRETKSPVNREFGCRTISGGGIGGGGRGRGMTTCEGSLTSSAGASRTSAETSSQKQGAERRKRKANEAEATEFQNEDDDFDFPDTKKKQSGGITSTKRARAVEVHNLSERRRRDRINEKMNALQELIPRCNKTDKASMLDDAIDYLKSMQLQVQMMSMGYGMMPMMYPGVQHFMPSMGMGIGMGMEMGVSRPMVPYPNMLAGSALPRPSAASHWGAGYSVPGFHIPPLPNSDPSRIQQLSHSDHMLNSLRAQSTNQPSVSTFVDSYQQFPCPSQMQSHHTRSASQKLPEPGARNQCSSKRSETTANHSSG